MRGLRPLTATDACRRDLASDLHNDVRRLDRQLSANETQTRQTLAAASSTLTTIHGVGHIVAGKILGHIGDITRFPTADGAVALIDR